MCGGVSESLVPSSTVPPPPIARQPYEVDVWSLSLTEALSATTTIQFNDIAVGSLG